MTPSQVLAENTAIEVQPIEGTTEVTSVAITSRRGLLWSSGMIDNTDGAIAGMRAVADELLRVMSVRGRVPHGWMFTGAKKSDAATEELAADGV